MKMYKWKPSMKVPSQDSGSPHEFDDRKSKKEEPPKSSKRKDPESMDKKGLVYTLQFEHPTVTLNVGTINVNLKRASDKASINERLLPTIKKCLQEVVRLASQTRRTCERAIAVYLSRLPEEHISDKDKQLLDMLCPRLSATDDDGDDDLDSADENSEKNPTVAFLLAMLNSIYNGRLAKTKKYDVHLKHFIHEARDALPAISATRDVIKMCYPASSFMRSTAVEMTTAMKVHFRQGSRSLFEQ
ncbi:hypothetical protein BGZ58_005346, partial [Dissophora ornata]